METVITGFTKLAMLAIKRELSNNFEMLEGYEISVDLFSTVHVERSDKSETVTIWFELKADEPVFWDLQPVVVVYRGHKLYLSDVCERTAQYFKISARRFYKKRALGDLNEN